MMNDSSDLAPSKSLSIDNSIMISSFGNEYTCENSLIDAQNIFVEISLRSDEDNDDEVKGQDGDFVDFREQFENACHVQPSSSLLVEVDPIFPRNHSNASSISSQFSGPTHVNHFESEFFEPACTPSPPLSISPKNQNEISFTDSFNDLKFNEELATAMGENCTLLSPSIVKAITSDIAEIKRSLAANPPKFVDLLTTSAESATLTEFVPSNLQHDTKIKASDRAHSQSIPSLEGVNEKELLFGHRLKLKKRSHLKESRNRSIFGRTKTNNLKRTGMLESNGEAQQMANPSETPLSFPHSDEEKRDGLAIQQWTFPVAANTVYSSSSCDENISGDDGEVSSDSGESKRVTRDREPERPFSASVATRSLVHQSQTRPLSANQALRMETHSGEWELTTEPPVVTVSRVEVTASLHSSNEASFQSPNANDAARQLKISSLPIEKMKIIPVKKTQGKENDYESDEDTDQLLEKQYKDEKVVEIPELREEAKYQAVRKCRGREVAVHHPDFPDRLIEGLLYPSRYLGSTQLVCDGRPSKMYRLRQAQEAVNRIKAPADESQPSVAVELFISTERVLILNKELDEIVMDHNLRLISYIADIGDILVLMTRRRPQPTSPPPSDPESGQSSAESNGVPANGVAAVHEQISNLNTQRISNQPSKIICHLFESDEARVIAQSIGRAFQQAYYDFLREHGIEDPAAHSENDYQNVLNQQEIFRNELQFFADKDQEKQVIVPKHKGEALGVVIVESGWGSVLPTAVLANMYPAGPAARCGQLNIGNQIISVNGQSLVGLPLLTCQSIIKATKNKTAVKLVVVSCPPVVEVLIHRPDQKYQLGFSVQDGVICSLLRGGIAERGGIRVDHRIIEINGDSVVAVPHERIVQLLATSVGEIYIRTMQTSIFRLLTGQESPHYI